jgi:lysophospholipase L1-like esterase
MALALGLSEVVVRIAAPQQLIVNRPDIWTPVETLGWMHRANVDTTINTGERTVRVLTDEDGFRVGRQGRIHAMRRVLVLGDSFMEAFQVEYEESVPGLLQRKMQERFDEPVAIRNAAVGAWDPNQYLLQLERSLGQEAYEVVLVMIFLGNDVVDYRTASYPLRAPAQVHPFRFPRTLTAQELIDSVLYPVNDMLEVRSHLFILLKKQARALLVRLGLTGEYFPPYFRASETESERWDVTADILAQIETLAEGHGSSVEFVLLPAHFQVDKTTFYEFADAFYGGDADTVDPRRPNHLLAAALREREIDFLDTLPLLETAHENGRKLYGDVDSHFTAAGHEVVAEAVAPILTARLRERISEAP